MSLYRVTVRKREIEIEVDGESMKQIVNLPRIREMGDVVSVEMVSGAVRTRPPESDVVGACEACGTLILDFERYQMDEDGIFICYQCSGRSASAEADEHSNAGLL